MKTDKTAGRILASLSLIAFLLSIVILYIGVKTEYLENKILNPIRSYANDFLKSWQTTPTPISLPTPSASPTLSPKPTIIKSTVNQSGSQPTNCIRKNIREGEFVSNKCYSRSDYDDLQYYLQRFNSSVFDLDTAQGTIKITCNCRVQQECDFFKSSCEEAKKKAESAQNDINRYREIVRGIIAKGR